MSIRDEFTTWATDRGYAMQYATPITYVDPRTEAAWQGFLSSRTLLTVTLPKGPVATNGFNLHATDVANATNRAYSECQRIIEELGVKVVRA